MAFQQPILQLGDFQFVTFEEPESVTFGKHQATYKHIMIGGKRIIDVMGAGDPDISWNGYFTGIGAEERARFLERMASEGQELTLLTSEFVKRVIISDFTYDYHRHWPIKYTITLLVVTDLTNPVTQLVQGDISDVVLDAIVQVADIATQVGNPSVSNAIGLVNDILGNIAPLDQATADQIREALAAASNAQTAIGQAITQLEAGVFS